MKDAIVDVAALEACIGKAPGAVNLKVIDHLDAAALRWLQVSPLVFAAFGDDSGIAIALGGGEPGFARAFDATHFDLPRRSRPCGDLCRPRAPQQGGRAAGANRAGRDFAGHDAARPAARLQKQSVLSAVFRRSCSCTMIDGAHRGAA